MAPQSPLKAHPPPPQKKITYQSHELFADFHDVVEGYSIHLETSHETGLKMRKISFEKCAKSVYKVQKILSGHLNTYH